MDDLSQSRSCGLSIQVESSTTGRRWPNKPDFKEPFAYKRSYARCAAITGAPPFHHVSHTQRCRDRISTQAVSHRTDRVCHKFLMMLTSVCNRNIQSDVRRHLNPSLTLVSCTLEMRPQDHVLSSEQSALDAAPSEPATEAPSTRPPEFVSDYGLNTMMLLTGLMLVSVIIHNTAWLRRHSAPIADIFQ